MATNSSSLPLSTSEDESMAFKSSVSPTSTEDVDNLSEVQLLSNLNNRIHTEGDAQLRVGSSSSQLEDQGTTIDSLPDELMVEIFSYVSFWENINVLQKVCTRWRILAQDAHVWRHKKFIITQTDSEEDIIAAFPAVPQLRTVILQRKVSPAVLEALSRSCPHLTTLDLYWQMLTYSEADILFDRCREIRTLTIPDNGPQTDIRVWDAVARLADLRVLRVREYANGDTKMAAALRELCVREYANGGTEIPLCILADGCPHLSDLYLPSPRYRIRDAEYFISSHKCVLKRLRIRCTSVEGRSITPLLPCVTTLRHLELLECQRINPQETAEALTALGQLHNLRELRFGITDWKVRHLVPTVFENGRWPNLQELELQDIVVDETTRALAKHCPELRELRLLRCEGHTDALFEPLHQFKKLEILEISFCACLGGKAMSYIAKPPALHTLEFYCTNFDGLKPSVDCILEMSELRRLYLIHCFCYDVPFTKFPGRLVNLRELQIVHSAVHPIVLYIMSAQMPDLTVESGLQPTYYRYLRAIEDFQ